MRTVYFQFEVKTASVFDTFISEKDEAETSGAYSVEYACIGDVVHAWVTAGGHIGKSRARSALTRVFEDNGREVESNTPFNVTTPRQQARQWGQLVPSLAVYHPPCHAGGTMGNPCHAELVVEIHWMEDLALAMAKVQSYLAPQFLGPNNTIVREVWTLLLPPDAPTPPEVLTELGDVAALHALSGEEDIAHILQNTARTPVLLFHARGDVAFAPVYCVLDWNKTVCPPSGSVFSIGFATTPILRTVYRGRCAGCTKFDRC
jgi:hypothetical protein